MYLFCPGALPANEEIYLMVVKCNSEEWAFSILPEWCAESWWAFIIIPETCAESYGAFNIIPGDVLNSSGFSIFPQMRVLCHLGLFCVISDLFCEAKGPANLALLIGALRIFVSWEALLL